MKIIQYRWLRLFVALLLLINQATLPTLAIAQSSTQATSDSTATVNNPTIALSEAPQDQGEEATPPYVEQF